MLGGLARILVWNHIYGDSMTPPVLPVWFPLSLAHLCCDCAAVSNCASVCPACASTALLALAPVMNREEKGAACER